MEAIHIVDHNFIVLYEQEALVQWVLVKAGGVLDECFGSYRLWSSSELYVDEGEFVRSRNDKTLLVICHVQVIKWIVVVVEMFLLED